MTYIEQGRIIDTDGKEVPMTQLGPKMRVGLRVKELRAGLGVSQEAFAYSIEMSRTYFAEVETGKRNVSIENIERIAGGLGVSLREFFDSDLECYASLWIRFSATKWRCRIRLHYFSPKANGATRRAEFECAGQSLSGASKGPAPARSARVRARSLMGRSCW